MELVQKLGEKISFTMVTWSTENNLARTNFLEGNFFCLDIFFLYDSKNHFPIIMSSESSSSSSSSSSFFSCTPKAIQIYLTQIQETQRAEAAEIKILHKQKLLEAEEINIMYKQKLLEAQIEACIISKRWNKKREPIISKMLAVKNLTSILVGIREDEVRHKILEIISLYT
jgi:hypothetical protein